MTRGIREMSSLVLTMWVGISLLLVAPSVCAAEHVSIPERFRVGSSPCQEGTGWIGEAFLNIPDEDAGHLVMAENYIAEREPDFTFRTEWIDFPAGPKGLDLDTSFATVGDFLNDYIYDVSDPKMLEKPFCTLILRFSGFISVRIEDDSSERYGLPVWLDFGSLGQNGFRTRVVTSIYRRPIVDPDFPFDHENAAIRGVGLFPIEITYFNRYDDDPDDDIRMEYAGIELYSWHEGGLPWPAGAVMVHPRFGQATIVPPRVIYQEDAILPLVKGDFDADYDVDLLDYAWLQFCFTGPNNPAVNLKHGCSSLDFDDNDDVDDIDVAGFLEAVGKTRCP